MAKDKEKKAKKKTTKKKSSLKNRPKPKHEFQKAE